MRCKERLLSLETCLVLEILRCVSLQHASARCSDFLYSVSLSRVCNSMYSRLCRMRNILDLVSIVSHTRIPCLLVGETKVRVA